MDLAKLIASPAALTLSLALLHFLWQGLALAVFAAAGLLALRRAAPNARYVFLLAVLLLMLASPIATLVELRQNARPVPPHGTTFGARIVTGAAVTAPAARVRPAPSLPLAARVRQWAAERMTWFAAFWAMGVVALSLRLLLGWIGLTSLRRGETRPLEAEWQARLSRMAERLRFRRSVELLESARVLAPTLVGWLRPAILLPVSAVAGLTPEQLEAIIAHELAHLRRHDYLVNLLQSVVETLLFYHPAVWWLSRRIRLERECCCDDLAVAACGDAMVYARALTALGALPAPRLAPAATGGALSVRIRRLLSVPAPRGDRRPPWLAGVVALAAVAVLIASLQTPSPAVTARRETVKRMITQAVEAVQVYTAPEAATLPMKPVATAPKLVTVDMRSASIADVARVLTTASGASIVMDKGLTGTVTVKQKNGTVDAVLASICRARGWYWRKDERGAYYVSAKQFAAKDSPGDLAAKAPASRVVVQMYKLQYASPQYVVYQLGLSDDPGPEPYLRDPSFGKPLFGAAAGGAAPVPGGGRAGAGGGGGGRGGGAGEGARQTRLGSFLPEGITEIVAYPALNSLLIRGTEEGIDKLSEFLKLIDKKPQQIIIEAKVIRVRKGALEEHGVQWFHNAGNLAMQSPDGGTEAKTSDLLISYQAPSGGWEATLEELVATSQAKVTGSLRVATMNLLPAQSTVTTRRDDGQLLSSRLGLVPRINGDGTITMRVTLSGQQDSKTPQALPSINAVLNVRDREAFALGGWDGSEEETIVVITPSIVRER